MNLSRRLDEIEPIIIARSSQALSSIYGVVDSLNEDGSPNFIRRWKGNIGDMVPTDEEPTIFIIEALEPIILKHKKYKLMLGGRAGTKSIAGMDAMVGDVNSVGSKVFVLREHMKSLKNSIYAGMISRIATLNLGGFVPVPSQWEIKHANAGVISFGGMANIRDIKSSFKYKYILLEEADRTKQETLDVLGPTLRGVEGAELWAIWNPGSSSDAMSQEFILPYQEHLDRDGYYEDEYHLIIKVGFEQNPWFMQDSSLRTEYNKDTQKVADGRMSKARYNHIWHGAFNDDVEDSVITQDMFDACIDAHLKLGFKPRGPIVAGHDPSDVGEDAKGFSVRHGVVFTDMEEIEAENANRAFDIACRKTKDANADSFGWDCDGLGALLRDQAAANFGGTKIESYMYKGSESVHDPEQVFEASDNYNMKGEKKNKDVFKNKKAQNIISFAERCRKTYEAVALGEYHDPDHLISFATVEGNKDNPDINGISAGTMSKLRAECCKLPLKPSDKICFYTKAELRAGIMIKGNRIVIPSPNLFDAASLSFDKSSIIVKIKKVALTFQSIS